mgnify:CR=1 FL=1
MSPEDVRKYIDLEGFIRLTNVPIGTSESYLIEELCKNRILVRREDGLFSITIMGALLFCRSLDDFPNLVRRALRIIRYDASEDVQGRLIPRNSSRFTPDSAPQEPDQGHEIAEYPPLPLPFPHRDRKRERARLLACRFRRLSSVFRMGESHRRYAEKSEKGDENPALYGLLVGASGRSPVHPVLQVPEGSLRPVPRTVQLYGLLPKIGRASCRERV